MAKRRRCSRAADVHSSHHRLESRSIRIAAGALRFLLLDESEEFATLCLSVSNKGVDVHSLAFYRAVHI